jgi:hypothetical protein
MTVRFRLRLLWGRTGYRPLARLLHRLNLHHTVRIGPLDDGVIVERCEWCGLSGRLTPPGVRLSRSRDA